jgi:divalent metal cation (Fe/Co/Zn/Cd) transporter
LVPAPADAGDDSILLVEREIGFAALVPDAARARIGDEASEVSQSVGVAAVALGLLLADPLVGLAIVVAILFELRSAPGVCAGLMDAVDAVRD